MWWINRPNLDFRGFAGRITAGRVPRRRSLVRVVPSGRCRSTVAHRIVTLDGDLPKPSPASRSPLTLADEIDIRRGDSSSPPSIPRQHADQFPGRAVLDGRSAAAPSVASTKPSCTTAARRGDGHRITAPASAINSGAHPVRPRQCTKQARGRQPQLRSPGGVWSRTARIRRLGV